MTADRMTEEEARRRLASILWVATCRLNTISALVDAILAALDALAVLVDWPKLLEAGERAGKGPLTELRALRAVAEAVEKAGDTLPSIRDALTAWRALRSEDLDPEEGE